MNNETITHEGVITEISDEELTISLDGHIDYCNKRTFTSSVSAGKINTTNSNTLQFGKGWLLFTLNSDNQMVAPTSNSTILAVKKENADDLLSEYSVFGEKNVIDSKSYLSIMVNKGENQYNSIFFNQTDNLSYLGITFDLMQGESILDEHAIYYVKDGSDIITGFGYNDKGRCLIASPMGVYTNDAAKLIIPNEYVAYLGENRYSWSYSAGVMTLQNSQIEIELEINLLNMTFTQVGAGAGISNPPIENKEFIFSDKGNGECTEVDVVFDTYNEEISAYTGTLTYYLNSSTSFVFGFNATVDNEERIIEMTITSQNIAILFEPQLSNGEYKIHCEFSKSGVVIIDFNSL